MVRLSDDRYLDALTAQSAKLADALRGADLATRVPTCPEWTLQELVTHLGQAHRHASAIITTKATSQPDQTQWAADRAPDDADGLGRWLRTGAADLVDAVRLIGPETTVWSWSGDPRVAFWARRMAHETAVHRADVELTLGRPFVLEADLAADAISEGLGLLCSPQARQFRPDLAALDGIGEVLHLHSTDAGLGEAGEWIIRRTPSGPAWEHGHAKGGVAVRGTAVDLLLVLTRRVGPDEAGVQVLGDRALLDHWLEHTAI